MNVKLNYAFDYERNNMTNSDYVTKPYRKLSDVKLPKFQRSIVWNRKKRLELLSTLHRDFPFGSLLLAPLPGGDEYRLLDGQQRLSTIREYEKEKVPFWKSLNETIYNDKLNEINVILKDHGEDPVTAKKFESLLHPSFELADWTDEYEELTSSPDTDKKIKKQLRNIVKDVRKRINDYINLDQLQIPVVIFKGKEEDLPEVYENLNKGGIPLTKYEIFNAAWANDTLTLPKNKYANEILQNVKNYYNTVLSKGGFDIDNFSEDELTSTREVNLAEFGRSLGKFTVDRIPSLISLGDDSAVNEIGFGLLGIFTGVDNKSIESVHLQIDDIKSGLAKLLENVNRIAVKINDVFSRILRQNISFSKNKKAKKQVYSTGLSSSFKILSYFASLWDSSEKEINKQIVNIPVYYVFDFLSGSWNAHGDQRLYQYYPDPEGVEKRSYAKHISKGQLRNAFDVWISDNPGAKIYFSKEVKALITIHSNLTYLSGKLPNGEDFEFEHIIPKARIVNGKNLFGVYLSSIGNGMFLPKSENNLKKENTIYEFDSNKPVQLKKDLESIKGSHYFSAKDFTDIFHLIDQKQYPDVNSFITRRANEVMDDIVNGLVN